MFLVRIFFALFLDSLKGNFPNKVERESCLLRYLLICRIDFIKDSKQGIRINPFHASTSKCLNPL